MLTAEQMMTTGIITIRPEATLHDAIELILARHISGLPVVDGDQKIVGIITEFALLALAYDQGLQHQTVQQHMTSDVISVDVADPVSRMADQFILHRIRWAPVTEQGRLVGLVTRRDVLRALEDERSTVAASV